MAHFVLSVLGVLQIFSGYAHLHMYNSGHRVGSACEWMGAINGGVGRTSHSVRCKWGKTASFAAWITWARVFWVCCRLSLGMPTYTYLLGTMRDVHANGGVLIMVGLEERAFLRCKWVCRKNCRFFFNEKIAL